MNIVYDAQIFRQQRHGGISRYFREIAARIGRMPQASALMLAPTHRNADLSDLGWRDAIAWGSPSASKTRWQRFGTRWAQRAQGAQGATMAAFRPDIVHETYFWGPIIHGNKPPLTVLTIYDMLQEKFRAMFPPNDRTVECKHASAHRADHVICISNSTKRDVMETLNLPEHKVTVTHLASSFSHRPQHEERRDNSRKPFVLYVGDRGLYKNFARLVAALGGSRLLRDIDLHCFGGGDLKADEWQTIDAAGVARERIVHHQGSDEQLADLYAAAECFVYPSLYEGFGIPPLEAMQCGCPVVCSNTSSIPEVVGDAGVYFDPLDVDAIRHAVESVVSSEPLKSALRAKGTVRARKFSWDRCAAETAAVYRTALARQGK